MSISPRPGLGHGLPTVLVALLIAATVPATAKPATAAVAASSYHITMGGSDSNPGTAGAPWRTLQKAANTLGPGMTVFIHPGTYQGFSMYRSGSSGQPIVFRALPGASRPVISGTGRMDMIKLSALHDVTLDGLVVQGAAGGGGSGAGIRIENRSTRVVIKNSLIRNNRSYGINVNNSTFVTVSANEIAYNEEGVNVSRAGAGVLIEGNRIHHQDKLVVNTANRASDDHGAVGIALVRTTGKILITKNQLWANRAASYDYGWDGGAFEIYSASNVTITGNRTFDNENVLETGSDGVLPCADNVFRHNESYGATSAGRSFGLFIRCGDGMIVAHNVFHNLDQFVFSVGGASRYNGSFEGLRIENNIAVMAAGKIIGIESALPASVVIDHNLMDNTSGGYIASVRGKGSTKSLATFRSWTGFERHGLNANPKFVAASSRNYRLAAGSPAIDRGADVFGSALPYAGSAPDLGRFETGAVVASTEPPIASAPVLAAIDLTTVGLRGTTPRRLAMRLSWAAARTSGTITRYEIQHRANGGAWGGTRDVPASTRSLVMFGLDLTATHGYRVRARDGAGRWSAWARRATDQAFRTVGDRSASVIYGGAWRRVAVASATNGVRTTSRQSGATARLTFSGRGIALVMPRSTIRGKVAVYLDGALAGTVDTRAGSVQPRRVVFHKTWTRAGTHTIKIRVLGTSGRPTVSLDGFVVLR